MWDWALTVSLLALGGTGGDAKLARYDFLGDAPHPSVTIVPDARDARAIYGCVPPGGAHTVRLVFPAERSTVFAQLWSPAYNDDARTLIVGVDGVDRDADDFEAKGFVEAWAGMKYSLSAVLFDGTELTREPVESHTVTLRSSKSPIDATCSRYMLQIGTRDDLFTFPGDGVHLPIVVMKVHAWAGTYSFGWIYLIVTLVIGVVYYKCPKLGIWVPAQRPLSAICALILTWLAVAEQVTIFIQRVILYTLIDIGVHTDDPIPGLALGALFNVLLGILALATGLVTCHLARSVSRRGRGGWVTRLQLALTGCIVFLFGLGIVTPLVMVSFVFFPDDGVIGHEDQAGPNIIATGLDSTIVAVSTAVRCNRGIRERVV